MAESIGRLLRNGNDAAAVNFPLSLSLSSSISPSPVATALLLALALHAGVLLVVAGADYARHESGAATDISVYLSRVARTSPSTAYTTDSGVQRRPDSSTKNPGRHVAAVATEPVDSAGQTAGNPIAAPMTPFAEAQTAPTPTGAGTTVLSTDTAESVVPESAAHIDSRYLQNPVPPYPPMSRSLGETGQVLLRVQVSETGSVLAIAVEQSSGFARLDMAARKAVQNWRFVPARHGDEAVASFVLIPLRFGLTP